MNFHLKAQHSAVKTFREFVVSRLVAGMLVATPVYLAALLLVKAMKSLSHLIRPLAKLLPDRLHSEEILSLLFVFIVCFLIGLVIRTSPGRGAWNRIESSLLERIPGYSIFRGLTQRLTDHAKDQAWNPALVEIEQALVPAFIIEELEDGRFTVFIPSVPTPLAGAIYILSPDRVHPLNIPFMQAIKVVSQWGAGSKDLILAMERTKRPVNDTASLAARRAK